MAEQQVSGQITAENSDLTTMGSALLFFAMLFSTATSAVKVEDTLSEEELPAEILCFVQSANSKWPGRLPAQLGVNADTEHL